MATVPLSGTNIRLLTGVPFSNDYRNTRWFDSKTEQTNYFHNKRAIFTASQSNFQRAEGRTFLAVNRSIDQLRGCNYIMFQNAEYNNKYFYGFVTHLEYKNLSATWVHFQIDVFQTWCFDMDFKPSYVVREHRKLWNADGSPVINTLDEGLDYGTEYDTVKTVQYLPNKGYKWLVIVTKNAMHTEQKTITPTVIGTVQPLSYYIIPFKDDGTTPVMVMSSTDTFPLTEPQMVLKWLYQDEEAVNNVVSLYVTEHTGIPFTFTVIPGGSDQIAMNNPDFEIENVVLEAGNASAFYIKHAPYFLPLYEEIWSDKYSGYHDVTESKLLMHPYCVTVADDFKGSRTTFKNEYIDSKKFYINMKGSLGLSNRVSVNVPDYNHQAEDGQSQLTSNETALISSNANDVPIINDLLSAFLQGNRNSLEVQKSTLLFNAGMNTIGSAIGIGSASSGIGMAQQTLGAAQSIGNTVLDFQAINAKQQDIANIPPQIAKMGSNTAYDYGNGYEGVFFMKKQIKPEYRKKLTHFFRMFGYKTNEYKIPNFHTRQNWNFVQTKNCNILGNFNNDDLNELKAIFDNGITFWHTDDVGNYSLDNEVI